MSVSHARWPSCTFQMRFVNELLARCGLLLKICIPMAPQYLTAPTLQPGALQCYRTCAVSRSFPMEAVQHFPQDSLSVAMKQLRPQQLPGWFEFAQCQRGPTMRTPV